MRKTNVIINVLTIILLLVCFHVKADIIRIDFVSECPEEFDVFFKKGFESLGYDAFVNYYNRMENEPYDLLLTYEWHDTYLKIFLYNRSGQLIRNEEKNFPYLDGIENLVYLMLSDMMDRRVNVKEYRGKVKGLNKNAMIKLDSAVYILQVHNGDSALAVKNFLLVAKELTGNYEAYYDFTYYQFTYYEVGVVRSAKASRLFGVVIGKASDGIGFAVLSEPPDIFRSYIEKILIKNPLPGRSPENDTAGRVYFIRSTGFAGSFVPFSVFVDNKFVCYLGNEEYLLLDLEPGRHIFTMQNSSKEVKSYSSNYCLEVLSGQKYFIKPIQETDITFTLQFFYQREQEYAARILLQRMVESKCTLDK